MAAKQAIVEINGKRYNSVTGKLVVASHTAPGSSKKSPVKSIEGIVRTRGPAAPKMPKPVESSKRPVAKIDAVNGAATGLHQRTKRSNTLVRSAVSKPTVKKTAAAPASRLQVDPSVRSSANPERQKRAKNVPLHHLVNRFGLPVTTSPEPEALTPAPRSDKAALPAAIPHTAPSVLMPSTIVSSTHKQLNNMIDRAMDKADAHKQRPPKHHKRRLVPLASLGLAAVLLIGFYAYQNVPNAALQVAMKRSGVHASLPGYTPSGFAFSGPIRYNDGQLTVNYSSDDNSGRHYDIKVKKSGWNNEALLNEFVQNGNKQYQIMQDAGKTIYIYDDQNATWVEQGSWYTIESSARLNPEQLLKIAGSI